MGKLMTTTFFNFLLGFVMILALSLGIIFATGQLDTKLSNAKNEATVLIAEILDSN